MDRVLVRWAAIWLVVVFTVGSAATAAAAETTARPRSVPPGPAIPTSREWTGGYDVGHYTLDLDLTWRTGPSSMARRNRGDGDPDQARFNLDYRGPEIVGVALDGAAVPHQRLGGELVVQPPTDRRRSDLHGRGRLPGRPDGGSDRFERGWSILPDSVFVAGEPAGAEVAQ